MLQITYVELDPKSVIPIHRDDCTYFTGKPYTARTFTGMATHIGRS